VPSVNDSYSSKLSWLHWGLPYLFSKPERRVDELCAENICRLWRVVDRPSQWSPEFNCLQDRYHSWEFAALLVRLDNSHLDFAPVLRDIKFGDETGWMEKPPSNYVFVHQSLPDTTQELTELSKSFAKACFGKRKDARSLSAVDGSSSVPLATHAEYHRPPPPQFLVVIYINEGCLLWTAPNPQHGLPAIAE
jgi:hypothetical protein